MADPGHRGVLRAGRDHCRVLAGGADRDVAEMRRGCLNDKKAAEKYSD